ncbi:hypothetical protein D047_1658A, partial [Vibrio parahaemolyticus VPTS-2010_2]
MLNLLI